ncbi:MAG TPA: hypothetical protein VFL60_04675 [Gaiellaceae bacterium]|nr:hypothetical protein [Gaiellaceae bacterium]
MPRLAERRLDAWTALAVEPAVRAAERAIATASAAALADTLAIASTAECRRRLRRVLHLKQQAAADPALHEPYRRAADELRAWAASVYLAVLHGPPEAIERWEWEGGAVAPGDD